MPLIKQKYNYCYQRKQESRTYRNMIKMELGRKSPELRSICGAFIRVKSKSPERIPEKSRGRSSSQSPTTVQNPAPCKKINGKIIPASISEKNKSPKQSIRKSPKKDSKNSPSIQSPVSFQKPTFKETAKMTLITRSNRSKSPKSAENARPNSPSGGLNFDEFKRDVSLKQLDRSKSPSPKLNTSLAVNRNDEYYYPRRKSEFEKSRIFRKLQEELDRESPEDFKQCVQNDERTFQKEKSPSSPKYNDSFYKIKDYPRRISTFEKSETFSRVKHSLNDEEKKNKSSNRSRSSSPTIIVKSSYEKVKESSPEKEVFKTTFNKLQEELSQNSPECKIAKNTAKTYRNFPKETKSESNKSRMLKKLHVELSSSRESHSEPDNIQVQKSDSSPPDDESNKQESPVKIFVKNEEVEISKNFMKPQQSFEKLRSVELIKDHLLLNEKKNESNTVCTLQNVDLNLPEKSMGQDTHKIVNKDTARSPSPILQSKNVKKEVRKIEKKIATKPTQTSINSPSPSPKNEVKISSSSQFNFSSSLKKATEANKIIQTTSKKNDETFQSKNENRKDTYGRTDSVESALQKFNSIDDVNDDSVIKNERRRSSDSRRSSLHAVTASWAMKTRSTSQHIHENLTRPKKIPANQKSKSKNSKMSRKSLNVKTEDSRDRSSFPPCKKQLFIDSESDIGSDGTKGSGNTVTIETHCEKSVSTSFKPSSVQQPPKLLRSIEDIRSSMTRDHKFMEKRNDESTDNLVTPKVTIRIISPNSIWRTEYSNQCVEFGISQVEDSPKINVKTALRMEKTPSSDDLSRKITSDGRKIVPAVGRNSELTLRPTSREAHRERESEQVRSFDVVDFCDNRTKHDVTENAHEKKNSTFVIELEDEPRSKSNANVKKTLNDRQVTEKIPFLAKQKAPSARPDSAASTNSSSSSNQRGNSAVAKNRMISKTRGVPSSGRTQSATKPNITTSNNNTSLPECKICGRRFAPDRISFHEQICAKTTQKKRKTFDPVVQRTKGTELEPFVKKLSKKGNDKKAKKPEVTSNWRRKHEDFINAIRSAKQMQAHLAAGGKLSDLPPPPASDTSDYIQCPHCGRKFNQAAAERHIPKCEHMLHNKPNPRAPPRLKR